MPCSKNFIRLARICLYIAKGYPREKVTKKVIRDTIIKHLLNLNKK